MKRNQSTPDLNAKAEAGKLEEEGEGRPGKDSLDIQHHEEIPHVRCVHLHPDILTITVHAWFPLEVTQSCGAMPMATSSQWKHWRWVM